MYCHNGDKTQLVVRQALRAQCLYLAHEVPLTGHQSSQRMLDRLTQNFYWPGIRDQVAKNCATCAECQLMQLKGALGGLLQPMPIVSVPFERTGVDLVGPLMPSSGRHWFILVKVDYATQYPEVMPLRAATTDATGVHTFCSHGMGFPSKL